MRKGIIYVYFNRAKYEKEGVEKYYVGQTVGTMEQRAGKDGKNYHRNNPNCNNKFVNSIRKWGWNAFEGRVLEEVYEEDLNELEKFYIEYFDSFKNGYNSTLGGEGTRGHNPYANKTEEEMKEIKEKLSKSQIIAQKKRFQDPEEREKISAGQRKRYKDPKERKKQSIVNKKRWEDKERRKKQSETIKKHWEDKNEREKQSIVQRKRWEDQELREKISKIQRKNWEDQEYREKQNIAQRKRWENAEEKEKITGEKNGRAKSVYCNELNIVFSYIKIAEEYCKNVLNSKISSISAACNGKLKSTGKLTNGAKLTWNWTENVDKKILDKAEYIDNKKYEEIINERKKCGISCELNYHATSVYCNELNIIFSYIKIAKKYCKNVLNSKISPIGYVCDGKIKYSGKLTDGTKLTWNWTKNLDKEILDNAIYIDSKKYEEIINKKMNN